MRYETARARAERLGTTVDAVRADANAGRIPGATRVGGPRSEWRFPVLAAAPGPRDHETRRAGELDGSAGQSVDRDALRDIMSTGSGSVLDAARRVAERVSVVRTRPARALSDLAFAVAAVASTHVDDRDGRCARCGWTYPCPDRRELAAALDAAADVVADGIAS